jgi:hypothetical protein
MMNSFLRPFGKPPINPFVDTAWDAHTEEDVLKVLTACTDWMGERQVMTATGIPLRRARTAIITAVRRKLLETRTHAVRNRSNVRDEYRRVI